MDLVSKTLWLLKPVIHWIDKTFTIPFSVKKITGDHYYMYRDRIKKGMVLLSNTDGQGSNIINPSSINHSAIYFGKGLRTELLKLIDELNHKYDESKLPSIKKKLDRLNKAFLKYKPNDDICYVIESVGEGVRICNLVKFMTTKDKFVVVKPRFVDTKVMKLAANQALNDLGLPYDYGFNASKDSKYCFEVCADAYEFLDFNIKLKRIEFKFFWKTVHRAFTSETFLNDTEKWKVIIDC